MCLAEVTCSDLQDEEMFLKESTGRNFISQFLKRNYQADKEVHLEIEKEENGHQLPTKLLPIIDPYVILI